MRLLSWNLALMERSAEAPASVRRDMIEDWIRRFVLDLAPDVVCWQELPNHVPFVETLDLLPATTRSHSGRMATLVRKERLMETPEPEIVAVDGVGLLATFPATKDQPTFSVANVHLEPGKSGTGRRLEQLGEIVSASPTERIVVVGDTNMRLDEIAFVEQAGFQAPKPPRPTWNSKRNRFRTDGYEFSAYFTRVFTSPGIELVGQAVHDTPVEHDGGTFYLSDHFALSAELEFVGIEAAEGPDTADR